MYTIPDSLPLAYTLNPGELAPVIVKKGNSQYDCAFDGMGFRYSNTSDNPIIRQLTDVQRNRVDQAQEAGEQTFSGWWLRSQSSFHGGGGQTNYEPPFPFATDRLRFDSSKNVDVSVPGHVKLLPGGRTITGTAPLGDMCSLSSSTGTDALAYRAGTSVKMVTVGDNPPPTNLITNGDFETNTAGWVASGTSAPTSFVSSTDHASVGSKSGKVTWAAPNTFFENEEFQFATVPGQVYTLGIDVYVPVGNPDVLIYAIGATGTSAFGPSTPVKGAWTRLVHRFTATATVHALGVGPTGPVTSGQIAYLDAACAHKGSTDGAYAPAAGTSDATVTITPGGTVSTLCTDGSRLWMVAGTKVYRADAVSAYAPVEIYSGLVGSVCKLAWVRDRLMLSDGPKIYQLDGSKGGTSVLGAGELVFTHPSVAYRWDGFTTSPTAIVAFGWDGVKTAFMQFTLTASSGTIPTLTPAGVLAELPSSERVTACVNTLGSFLAILSNKGLRIGTFESFRGALSIGPLSVTQTLLGSLAAYDRFIFTAAAKAPDEPGLIRLDLGLQTDQAGRFTWSYDRIGPVDNPTPATAPGECAVLPVTGRLVYWDAQGLYLSDPALPPVRTGWLRTSRIRYATTEPKLFSRGSVKMGTAAGGLTVTSTDDQGTTVPVATFYAQAEGEFRLSGGALNWLQLTFTLSAEAELHEWQMKALPGAPREEMIQVIVSCADHESSRTGQAYVHPRTAEARRDKLMALAASGAEFAFQEYQQTKTTSQNVVIEQCVFKQAGRPTNTQYTGGEMTVTMRTV